MNASPSTLLRALHGLGCVALLLTVFEACSGDEASTPLPPPGPASIQITGIALGQGLYGSGGASSVLGCDYKIGVNVQTTNWTLSAPGRCGGAPQCGQLRVTLFDDSNATQLLPPLLAAGNGVALDVSTLSLPSKGDYRVRAELIEDSGKPYVEVDGGVGWDDKPFSMSLPSQCPSAPASGGAGGGNAMENTAGAGGDSSGLAGFGGSAGAAGTTEVPETGGNAGSGGTAGIGGTAGVGGTPGVGGLGVTGGTSGTAGTNAGTAGG